ncbi:MAG: lipopolysaccharide biosynthesis protein [Prevotella sp.]
METLKEKTAKGLFWGGMNSLVLQVVGLAFGILLGRKLNSYDYGMLAAISIFSLVATALQDSGFKTALANLKEPTDRDYNSVFWFNILMGALMYGVLFFCAPLIARFYRNPEMVALCRYAFLSIVFASFGTAQSAWLFKHLYARQQATASMSAVLVSSTIGVVMAYCGMSYWSLATQGLVYVLVNTLLQWHFSAWRPSLMIDFGPVRSMFRFSCRILATTITTQVNNNVLNILLGRFYGVQPAGNYNQAYQWNFKAFSLVQGMVSQVAQPVLVDLQDQDGRQLHAFRKLMRFTAFIAFPLLFGLALVAREFIVLAITEKWLPSVPLLQLLCVSGAVMPLCTLLSNMIVSKGKSGIYFRSTALLCLLQIATMVALRHSGIRAMVMGYTALNVLWLFVWHRLVCRLTGYRLLDLLRDTLPFALTALGVMALTHMATQSIGNLWLLLASRILMAATLYYAAMRIADVTILRECTDFIMKRKRK